jgi:hypothetical protein
MRAISQVATNFIFQSYFEDTLLQKATQDQPANQLIVPSTMKSFQGEGHSVGLSGFADTPVAIKFRGQRDSAEYILKPGEVVRPGHFVGFDYGLPFGWLGGGLAMLKIAHQQDVILDMGSARPEVIFHRTRLKIVADAVLGGLAVLNNWPGRFPWTQMVRGANSIDQKGNSVLTVEPTQTLARLRVALAAAKPVRFIFRGSHDFDQGPTGAVTTADASFTDVQFAATPGTSQPFAITSLPAALSRLACDEGGVTVTDLGDAALTNQFIDVVRYGRI